MASLFRLLQKSDTVIRLYGMARRAAEGDPEAIEHLRRNGLYDIAELYRDGGGAAARAAVAAAREVWRPTDPNVIEGEFREVQSAPWEGFVKRLVRQPCGAHILIGPVGQGKTTLAKKLAQRVHEELGFGVECVNMYGEDVPEFASIIRSDTLVRRMQQLKWHLDSLADNSDEFRELEDQPLDPTVKRPTGPVAMPAKRKVIIIDEASLSLSTSPHDPARRAAIQALASCRHLDWVVILIGQWLSLIPLQVLAQSAVWFKKPDGKEPQTDRDNPLVREMWQEAIEAFADLPRSPWYQPPYKTPKAWAYCYCQSLNGQAGYTGLVPFTPAVGTPQDAAPNQVDEENAEYHGCQEDDGGQD